MLQTFPEYFQYGIVFDVLDELDQFMYITKNYWNYGLKDYIQDISLEDLIIFYNKCTENNVSPNNLIRYLRQTKASNLDLAIGKSYSRYLIDLLNPEETKLDFALLQREFFHLLKNNPEVLEVVRNMYDYIIIDEYQDTNPIQEAIFKLICEPKYNITVVGDEDQSIYGFRGASIWNFRSFLSRYPNAIKMELEENYRSSPEIVTLFDKFMDTHRIFEKNIFTNNPPFSKPLLIQSKEFTEEAKNIIKMINELVTNHEIEYGDITVLFKSVKNHSHYIIEELSNNEIPFISIGDSSLLTKDEIKDIILLMSYVNSFEPEESRLEEIFNRDILISDFLNLEQESIEKLRKEVDIFYFLDSFDIKLLKKLNINSKDTNLLINLKNLKIEQKRNKLSQLKLFYRILDVTGIHHCLITKFMEDNDTSADIKLRNLAKFSVLIHKFEKNTNSKKFKTFFYYLGRIPENKMDDSASYTDLNAVKLMTIHQAKGLEFPVVILAGVTERRYNRTSQEETTVIEIPKELLLDKQTFNRGEELQRTFYVGMSRAQKLLIISSFNGTRNKTSPFVEEIGKDMFINQTDFKQKFSEEDHYTKLEENIKLSYSAISAYLSCPFRFYFRDVLGFQTPIDYFQLYGVIVHNCLQKIHTSIKNGETLEILDIINIVDLYCKDKASRKQWRDELITDMWNYYQNVPNFIKEVLDVEIPFSYVDDKMIINGKADLVIRNIKDKIEIIDYKSRYQKGLKQMNVDIQLRIYKMGLQKRYDEEIRKISAYTFKDNKITRFTNTKADLLNTKVLITGISNSIENENFKRNWKGRYCETKSGKCDFYYICKNLE
ncbi:hypothetical protein LCGC14_1114480 [marine sediment metagenome]|uniref:DNA 3'-5' helicase n=1 Tax=marine sediment metagenome TaxID=412755 RepID=A0A0F9MTU0_9ZZZZ